MKIRLDLLLVQRGLATGRDRAKSLILEGKVLVDSRLVTKPSDKFNGDVLILLQNMEQKYVSRGGLKLEKAIKSFNIDLYDKICMDIGSSTGGFTDCMLQNGAKKVYAIDVGTDQLVTILRENEKVVVMENTNIRYLDYSKIKDEIDFITIDVAFISLKLVLPVAKTLLTSNSGLVCLIKPQFEAGIVNIGKNGVVTNKNTHEKIIHDIIQFSLTIGFSVKNLEFSPIKGPKGNIEYLLFLTNFKQKSPISAKIDIKKLVSEAYDTL